MTHRTWLPLLLIGLFSMSCANTKIAESTSIYQQANKAAIDANIKPEEAIIRATDKIKQAHTDKLFFYAPLHLEKAQKSIQKAQDLMNDKKATDEQVLKEAFAAEHFIIKGYETKKSVITNLTESLKHKEILEELNTQNLLPSKYENVVDKIIFLIKEIEGGNIQNALNQQADVLKYMTEVEIDVLEHIHLTEAETNMDKADNVDASEFAEATYEFAEKTIEMAEKYIQNNYRNRQGVEKVGKEAAKAAMHAYFVAKEAKPLVEMEPDQAEKYVLEIESMFKKINQSIDNVPVDSMPLYDYSIVLANKILKVKSGELAQPSEDLETTDDSEQADSTDEITAEPVSTENGQTDEQSSETDMEEKPDQ